VVPSEEVEACARNAGSVITSTMNRSRASAERIAPGRAHLSDPVFNESTLPRFNLGLPLPPKLWDLIARIAWFCGWSPDGESLSEARERARRGARLLAELAHAHGSVMLVGHGIMNALIRHELRRAGWKTSGLRSAYWSLMVARRTP
jgi:broad specificity phosphatase PhoE